MFRRWTCISFFPAAAVLVFAALVPVRPACGADTIWSRPSEDLLLTERQERLSDALSHYAWGYFLQLEEGPRAADARDALREALKRHPESRVILRQLVAPLVADQDFRRMRDILLPIAEESAHVPHLVLMTVMSLRAGNQTGTAISLLEKAYYEAGAKTPEILRELSGLYWRVRDDEAIEHLLRDARRSPELEDAFATAHAAALYHAAMADTPAWVDITERGARRHRKLALRNAEHAVDRLAGADALTAVDSLLDVFVDAGAWESATRLLEQATDVFPARTARLTVQKARCLREMGQRDKAVSELLGIDTAGINSATFYTEYGRECLQLGKLKEAAEAFNTALFIAPGSVQLRLTLAFLWLRTGRPEKALRLLENSRRLPARGVFMLSRTHYALDDLKMALHYAGRAETLARKSKEGTEILTVEFYLYYASLYEESGQTGAALEKAEKALQVDGANARAANFLGYVLADHNRQLERAEELIRLAVDSEPDSVAYIDSLAWVLYRRGEFAQALAVMNRALRLGGRGQTDPVILDHAGDIYEANGLPSLAGRYWWAALRAGAPDAKRVRNKLEKVLGRPAEAGGPPS